MIKVVIAALVASVSVSALSLPASAGQKGCPDGTYYDESKGKCVTKRGS